MTSTSRKASLFRRIAPMVALFFGIELLLRGALLAREWAEINVDISEILRAFAIGVLYDAAVAAWVFAPFLFFLSRTRWGSERDKRVTTGMWVGVLYLTLIHCFSEWSVWDDIGTRIDYIAWDYLDYPEECFRVVMEAFHGFWIIGAALLITPFFVRAVYRSVSKSTVDQPAPYTRGLAALLAMTLPLASFLFVTDRPSDSFANRHLAEVAKNGAYQLGSTFWRYRLPYDDYFLTGDEAEPVTSLVFTEAEEKRHNVVVIVIESMASHYLASSGSSQGLTPNLDQLAEESLFFSNHYACGTRTVRGVEAVSMGLPPIAGPSRLKKRGHVTPTSIGTLAKERGYDTRFFYNGGGHFDNMGPFLSQRDFAVTDRSTYEPDEVTFENLWGVSDEDLFRKVIKEADRAHEQDEPFFHLVMTMSNHRPFTFPDENVSIPSGTRDGAVLYTDYAIGRLMEEARTRPWFDNTLFVITADHTVISAGDLELTLRKHQIPLIIYGPGLVEAQENTALACQADIAPTIAGLLDWNYESSFYGRDLLKDGEERAFIGNFDHLALVKEGIVTILRPNKTAKAYTVDGEQLAEVPDHLLAETIAIYQGSSRL